MIVRIIGVRKIEAEPKYDRILYYTFEEYEEKFMNNNQYTAGNVWIDIPDEYNPKQEEDGVTLEWYGNRYKLRDVLLPYGPGIDGERGIPCLLFFETDIYNDGNDNIDGYAEIFIPLKYCYSESEIDILKGE